MLIFKEEEDIYVANINKHVLYSSLKHELIIYFNVQYFMIFLHMSKVTMTVTLLLAVSLQTKSSVCVNVVNNMCIETILSLEVKIIKITERL